MTVAMLAPPLGLYVHLPWCLSKCPYCDFNSHALRDELPATQYVDALLRDLAVDCARLPVRTIDTVFFGGGTPSLFPARELARILDAAARQPGLAPDAEITLEANPGAIERGRFDEYRAIGINRLSIGAQSFDADSLARLGRIHQPIDTHRAVRAARAAGFDRINLDLMYALPGQTVGGAVGDVEQALALGPSHLSHYQLTIEPNTRFHSQRPELPDQDAAASMQRRCQERLAAAGFEQYEVSAFTAEHPCRHNVNYWRYGDYLGIGAGAHGKVTDALRRSIVRTQKTRHPRHYLTVVRHDAPSEVARADRRFEYMLNNLRLEGRPIALADFERRTGLQSASLAGALGAAREGGLMRALGPGRWAVTATGWRFLNDLQALFLPDQAMAAAGTAVPVTSAAGAGG